MMPFPVPILTKFEPILEKRTVYMLYPFLSEPDIEKAERINHTYFAWTGKQADTRGGSALFPGKTGTDWKLKVPGDMSDFFPLED
jgi:hypothetical protein